MDKKTIKKDLKNIKNVLLKNKWIKNALAKKANGHTPCSPHDVAAKSFCLLGAHERARAKQESLTFMRSVVIEKTGLYSLSSFNDHTKTKKKDVLKFLDDCITSLK